MNGWIVFRFEMEEHMETVRKANSYSVFGVQLILFPLPPEFRFDSTPEFKFKVWVTLPNLPLELWNPSALGKIAAVIGEPITLDNRTIAKNNIDGPRLQVLVDAKITPLDCITLRLHNGRSFTQNISYDFYPLFCTKCKRVGHVLSSCRSALPTQLGMIQLPKTSATHPTTDGEWQVQRRKAGQGRNVPRPQQQLKVNDNNKTAQDNQQDPPQQAATPHHANKGTIPQGIQNTHIRFSSPSHFSPLSNLDGQASEAPHQELLNPKIHQKIRRELMHSLLQVWNHWKQPPCSIIHHFSPFHPLAVSRSLRLPLVQLLRRHLRHQIGYPTPRF